MTVPNQFGTATSAIPLSQLDANFNTPITLGNTAIQLGDTVTTLNNMTLANVTISSGNVTITNVAITTANVSGTANISTLVVVGNATVGGNTTITGNITATNANVTTNLVLSGGTANGVAYLNTSKVLTTGSDLVFDGTNLGVGVAPSVKLDIVGTASQITNGAGASGSRIRLNTSASSGGSYIEINKDLTPSYVAGIGTVLPGGSAASALIFSDYQGSWVERMRLDASGNLLVNATATGAFFDAKVNSYSPNTYSPFAGKQGEATAAVMVQWNAATSGDNIFTYFVTEASPTIRGTISYNRTAGLVAYNTMSDYRAKDIVGSVTDSGALIDSVPVYMGTMKGATQERPMFIAHETPVYAHTGEKDAVDKDGNPVYQQMDASALIPVMWAEIQELRKRLAAANL